MSLTAIFLDFRNCDDYDVNTTVVIVVIALVGIPSHGGETEPKAAS